MTQRDKGVPCVLCGFGPDTGIHLPALTGPRKGLPYGHEYYGPHVVVLQDPPPNVFANWPQSDRDAKSSLPQRGIEPGDENERLHYARIDSSSRVRSPLDHGPSTMNTIPQRGVEPGDQNG